MVEGDGESKVGDGTPAPVVTQTPAPDPVTNNSNTMVSRGLPCSHEGCDYKTPQYAAPEACKALELHIMAKHPAVFKVDTPPPPPTQASQPATSITIPGLDALVVQLQHNAVRPERAQPAARSEALMRPKVEGMSSTEWSFFMEKWGRYSSACQFEGARVQSELHACCSNNISRSFSQCGETYTSDWDLLQAIKKLAVCGHNALVQQVKFMQIKQSPGERFVKFHSCLKGASSDSDFVLTCKEASNPCCEVEDCGEEISYGKKMVFFQALVGMSSHTICAEIMKDIISNKMTSDLDELLDRVEALELAGESASALSTPSINRISEHQQGKADKKMGKGGGAVKPPATGSTGNGFQKGACSGCGKTSHKDTTADRRAKCPAWDI